MDQLGWTDPIKGDVELVASADLLSALVESSIVDAGDTIDDITDAWPFDRRAFEAATTRGLWLADRHDELATVG